MISSPSRLSLNLKVGNQLGIVDWHQFFERLDFNNHQFFHKHVHSIRCIDFDASIENRQGDLCPQLQAAAGKLVSKASFVRALQ